MLSQFGVVHKKELNGVVCYSLGNTNTCVSRDQRAMQSWTTKEMCSTGIASRHRRNREPSMKSIDVHVESARVFRCIALAAQLVP